MNEYLQNYKNKNQLRVIKTVIDEAPSVMWNEATRLGKKLGMSATKSRYLANMAIARFEKFCEGTIIEDNSSKALNVRKMYYEIWKDPLKTSKISNWASAKRLKPKEGPPQGSDEIILSTAANLADSNPTELLTFDHDFLIFAEEIKQNFCVDIMDASTIYI